MKRRTFCLALGSLPASMLCSSAEAAFGRRRRRRRGASNQTVQNASAVEQAPPAAHAFSEQFNQDDWWKARWGVGATPDHAERVDVATSISQSGKALHVAVPKGSNLGTDFSHYFRAFDIAEPETASFQYAIKFGETFTGHGKLPGLVGTYGRGGWGGRKANGENGWSARLGFGANNPDYVTVSYYSYHMDQKQAWGDNFQWQKDGAPYQLKRGEWYTLRGTVKLNTIGERDGELRAWINDEPVVAQEGLQFRKIDRLKIERFWFNIWHGGGKPAPVDMDVTIANLQVS